MKISYDPEVDALSIIFRETECLTEHPAKGIAFDYDAEGRLAAIEILNASLRLSGRDTLEVVVTEGMAKSAVAA